MRAHIKSNIVLFHSDKLSVSTVSLVNHLILLIINDLIVLSQKLEVWT